MDNELAEFEPLKNIPEEDLEFLRRADLLQSSLLQKEDSAGELCILQNEDTIPECSPERTGERTECSSEQTNDRMTESQNIDSAERDSGESPELYCESGNLKCSPPPNLENPPCDSHSVTNQTIECRVEDASPSDQEQFEYHDVGTIIAEEPLFVVEPATSKNSMFPISPIDQVGDIQHFGSESDEGESIQEALKTIDEASGKKTDTEKRHKKKVNIIEPPSSKKETKNPSTTKSQAPEFGVPESPKTMSERLWNDPKELIIGCPDITSPIGKQPKALKESSKDSSSEEDSPKPRRKKSQEPKKKTKSRKPKQESDSDEDDKYKATKVVIVKHYHYY